MPGSGGTNGAAPVATTMARVDSVFTLPSSWVICTVPRVDDLGLAEHHVDAQAGIAFDRVVRLDRRHDALHALHYVGERHVRLRAGDAIGRRCAASGASAWPS